MSLRIPLTKDQTLQVEFHEIERRLHRLERRTGMPSGGGPTSVQFIGGTTINGSTDLTLINQRLDALEAALAALPEPIEYDDYGLVGPTSAQGLVPETNVPLPPTGVAQHVLTEDHYWGFPQRGLVQVVTPGDETAQTDTVNVLGNLVVTGVISGGTGTTESEDLSPLPSTPGIGPGLASDSHTHQMRIQVEEDGVDLGTVQAVNLIGPGLDVVYEPNIAATISADAYGRWPLDEASGTRLSVLGMAPSLSENGGTVPTAAGRFGLAASSTDADTFGLRATLTAPLAISAGLTVAFWFYAPASASNNPKSMFGLASGWFTAPTVAISRYFNSDFLECAFKWSVPDGIVLPNPRLGPITINAWNLVILTYNAATGEFEGCLNDGCLPDWDYWYQGKADAYKLHEFVPAVSLAAANAATFTELGLLQKYNANFVNFEGRIDELLILSRPLTVAERALLWSSTRATVTNNALRGLVQVATEANQTEYPDDKVNILADVTMHDLTTTDIECRVVTAYESVVAGGILACNGDELDLLG